MPSRLIIITLASATVAVACPQSPPDRSTTAPTELKEPTITPTTPVVLETFSGIFQVPQRFDPDADLEPAETPPLLLQDAAAFASFVSLIPKERIQKQAPAPPSDDPLLRRDDIDWNHQMMLVAFDPDSMYGQIRFGELRLDGETLVAPILREPLGDRAMMAQPLGVGAYAAILITRFEGPVRFQ